MPSITLKIDGISSSAYMNKGSLVGTVPTIPKKVDNVYKFESSSNTSNTKEFYLSAYPNDGNDGIVSLEEISGDIYYQDYPPMVSVYSTGFSAYVRVDSSSTYIYVDPRVRASGGGYDTWTFNGSSGTGGGWGNYRWNISSTTPTLTAPSNVQVTQEGTNYKVSWTAAKGSNSSGSVEYVVTYGSYVTEKTTNTQITIPIPTDYYGKSIGFYVHAYYAGHWSSLDGYTGLEEFAGPVYFTAVQFPTITKQPSITSMNPSSGSSVTINWSAASVSNQGSSTIYYQYFVGPSSTYSDSYHVGTTTSLSATITEANILSKCGSGFDGVCYIFVRAYWDNGSTNGGWTTPTGKAFTYTPHRTIKYHNGSSWVECIPYYYNGSSWVECIPYYYNGSSWVECSH